MIINELSGIQLLITTGIITFVDLQNDYFEEGKVVVKSHADAFYKTNLEEVLTDLRATELLVSRMMTQNCITHTAISKTAEKYNVKILGDCCTTVKEAIHLMSLNAISTRIDVVGYKEAIK